MTQQRGLTGFSSTFPHSNRSDFWGNGEEAPGGGPLSSDRVGRRKKEGGERERAGGRFEIGSAMATQDGATGLATSAAVLVSPGVCQPAWHRCPHRMHCRNNVVLPRRPRWRGQTGHRMRWEHDFTNFRKNNHLIWSILLFIMQFTVFQPFKTIFRKHSLP